MTKKGLISFVLVLVSSSSVFAGSTKISKENLKLFDKNLVKGEEGSCLQAKGSKDWILAEIKKVSPYSPTSGSQVVALPVRDLRLFKIDDKPTEGFWELGSPDTKGEILKAPIIDLNSCTPVNIQKRNDLENKIWLVEVTPAIPDLLALTLEAKLHKALGLVIYGDDEEEAKESNLAIPVMRISKANAEALKKQIKDKSSLAELSLITESPNKKNLEWTILKMGSRDVTLSILANNTDCKAISILLGLLDWQKKMGLQLQGTVFGILSDESQDVLGHVATTIKIDPKEFDSDKFIKSWVKADEQIADIIDGKSVIKKALSEAGNFQGLIDKDLLNQYKGDLKTLESVVKIKPEVAFGLKNIYQSDELPALAQDLKNLKLVHDLAQKGQWEKAVLQFRKIREYDWAPNVSAATFLEYKRLTKNDLSVNASLWVTLQKGRSTMDTFLDAVEAEIDRLELLLSDNFFKIHKSVENLEKI